MRKWLAGGIGLWVTLWSTGVWAAPLDSDKARTLLRERLAALESFHADFSQTVIDAAGDITEESDGRFWLARPDRFRWEYQTPWPRLILSDGQRIWLYDEDLEQATVKNFDGVLEQTPAGLLAGRLELLDEYAVTGEAEGSLLVVRLVPEQPRADFRQIELEFDRSELLVMRLWDSFGQQTRIQFLASDREPPDSSLFEFTLPDGVDLIDESDSSD